MPLPIADRDDADVHEVHGLFVTSTHFARPRMRSNPAVMMSPRFARGSVPPPPRCVAGEFVIADPIVRPATRVPTPLPVILRATTRG